MAFLDETGLAELWSLITSKHNGFVNEYVWAKIKESQVDVIGEGDRVNKSISFDKNTSKASMYRTASLVNGVVTLSNQESVTIGGAMVGYYVYIDGSPYVVTDYLSSATNAVSCYVRVLSATTEIRQEVVEYVNSPNPSAYPISDGFKYAALGQLGNKAQVATGSYIGTGTFGESNPNVLPIGFNAKFVAILRSSDTTIGVGLLVNGNNGSGVGILNHNGSWHMIACTFSDDAVSWYSNAAYNQLNYSTTKYQYVAIG